MKKPDEKTKRGRPPTYGEKMKPQEVWLTPTHIKKAILIGAGKLSRGIRKALDKHQEEKHHE